jgi:hypothetical protein
MKWNPTLSPEAVEFTKPEIMAKVLSTIDSEGYPHLTMITSNIASKIDTVKWGEFTYGKSKGNVVKNPKQGMIYMTAAMPFRFLQVKADLDYISLEGDDAIDFNTMSLFRYNTYMRVYRVFFNKIRAARPIRAISLMGIVKGILVNLLRIGGKTGKVENRLNQLGNRLFSGPVFPKFLSYLDPQDGYPVIIPLFQARAVEKKRIVFNLAQFKEDLLQIPEGAKVSVFAMDMETVSQMVKGTFLGFQNKRGIIDIEYVYNSMPPLAGELYPNLFIREKVTEFI